MIQKDGLSFVLALVLVSLDSISFTCRRPRCLEREQPCRTFCMRMYVGGMSGEAVGNGALNEDEIKELRKEENQKRAS